MLIEAARARIVSSGLPPMIAGRAAGVLDSMASIRSLPAAHLQQFDAISQSLIANAANEEAAHLAGSLVLARVCVRNTVDTIKKFENDPGCNTMIRNSLESLRKRVAFAIENIHKFSFCCDLPILFCADPSYETGYYASTLGTVLHTDWFLRRPERFADVDVVEVIGRLDRKVVAGTSNDFPYKSTISINGGFLDDFLKYGMYLPGIFVHEERHIRNNYLWGHVFQMQDISDGFKQFRAEDTGLHSDRTRSNLIGEIDANLEEIRFFLEESGSSTDRSELERIDLKFQNMEEWARLVRSEIDPFRPMDPYEPLDPPLQDLLTQLESDMEMLHKEMPSGV